MKSKPRYQAQAVFNSHFILSTQQTSRLYSLFNITQSINAPTRHACDALIPPERLAKEPSDVLNWRGER